MSTFLRLVLLYCLGAFATANAAVFTFRFGAGFDDPTQANSAQAGNNPGLTLGELRRNMVIEAGRIWGALLVSNVPIIVDIGFTAQDCDSTSGTLASAGPGTYFRDFPGATIPNTFFATALADSLANTDLMQQLRDMARRNDPDITASFNLNVDGDSACLNGLGFYYGFDHVKGSRVDALIVALHEFAHGFGFASEVKITGDGTAFVGTDGVERFSTYVSQIFDENLGRAWPMLDPSERLTSAVGNAGLAWNGMNVRNNLASLVGGQSIGGRLRLFSPNPVSAGSSVSHWDRSATPNLLMEPNISRDLLTSNVDLTACGLRDIGWQTTRCPDNAIATGRAPISSQQMATVVEDGAVSITLMATDQDGDTLTYNVSQPGRGTVSGGTGPMRTYTPNPNQNGTDTFTFTANDGNGNTSAPATVTISITPVNDAPTATGFIIAATSGQPQSVGLIGSDVDGEAVVFEIVSNPANGALTGTGASRVYTSNSGFVGTDSFTFRTRDATTTSNIATITLTVMAAVAPSPSTPVPGGRGGGGGAMNELLLLALGLLAVTAQLHRSRLVSLQRVRRR